MGYILKTRRGQSDLDILSSSQAQIVLGLDKIGFPAIWPTSSKPYLELFTLRQIGKRSSLIEIAATELSLASGQSLAAGDSLSFNKSQQICWREVYFEIVHVPTSAFMLEKLGQCNLISARPLYRLLCPKYKIDLPVFSGTSITIGSHHQDSVRITDQNIKARHAIVKLSATASELEIFGCLGKVQSWVESGITVFRLIPSKIEFKLEPLSSTTL